MKKGFRTWENSVELARDREQQRMQKQGGKKGIDGGLTKGWYGSWCVCCAVLVRVVLGCAWRSIDC